MVAAHRGVAAGAAENTIEAFTNAIDIGADMIEFDVRMTRDGELIAFHDARVNGIAVGSLTRDDIESAVGVRPPLLTEVLHACAGPHQAGRRAQGGRLRARRHGRAKAISDPGEFVVTSFLPVRRGGRENRVPRGQDRAADRRERALGGPADLGCASSTRSAWPGRSAPTTWRRTTPSTSSAPSAGPPRRDCRACCGR